MSNTSTDIETVRKADWDGIERDVVSRIRVLKQMAMGLEPNPINDKIANEIIKPCVELLGQFVACVQASEEE